MEKGLWLQGTLEPWWLLCKFKYPLYNNWLFSLYCPSGHTFKKPPYALLFLRQTFSLSLLILHLPTGLFSSSCVNQLAHTNWCVFSPAAKAGPVCVCMCIHACMCARVLNVCGWMGFLLDHANELDTAIAAGKKSFMWQYCLDTVHLRVHTLTHTHIRAYTL